MKPMVAVHPIPSDPEKLASALGKLARDETLSAEEAALVKASMDPAVVAQTERDFGMPIEEVWEAIRIDPGIDADAELAFLRGEGPDPWPG